MANDEKVDILVVDDLPEKLLVYETILQGLGESVVTARSGREALRHLLEREFALILLDVHMPEMDGFETAALIRSRRQTALTPIIFITSFTDEMYTAHGYSLGAVDYILAPVVPEILRTKVGVFVDLYKKTRQVKRQAEEHVALARAQAARDAAVEANRRLAFLAEASKVLVHTLDYPAIPRGLVRQAIPFLGDLCGITLTGEPDQHDWRTELAWIDPANGSCNPILVEGDLPFDCLSDLIRHVLETGEPEFVAEFERPHREPAASAGPPAHAERDGLRAAFEPTSAIVMPLCARGHTLGTLALATGQTGRRLGRDDVALAADLAGRAAIAIDNARLYRDVQENNRRKNEFLAMLAHELRNPLAPIRSSVEVLQLIGLQDENVQWASEVISRQVDHLVRLVDDLLDISRITGGKIQLRREPIDASAAVARAVETSRPLIDARKHELAITLPPTPLVLNGDLVRLAQVLANLLNNAAKYTDEGGRIALDVARVGHDAVFRVSDNGIGIAAEKLPYVFDLFTQVDHSLDRSLGGLGIGLTLVRRLVEMHGGSVQAFSAGTNRGSEFIIRLPALDASVNLDLEDPESSAETECFVRRRILLVDDYPSVAESLMKLLELGGHEVRIAGDGPSALEEVTIFRPEIILLDIGLPGMDGYELAQCIRKSPGTESIILIAVTGYGQDEDRQRSREAGFDCHVTKPVDRASLFKVIAWASGRAARGDARSAHLSRA